MLSQIIVVLIVMRAVLKTVPLTASVVKVDVPFSPYLPLISTTTFKSVVFQLTKPQTEAKQVLSLRSAFAPYSNILLRFFKITINKFHFSLAQNNPNTYRHERKHRWSTLLRRFFLTVYRRHPLS